MILRINFILLFIFFCSQGFCNEIDYKEDGKYRLISSEHLINDLPYRVSNTYRALIEISAGTRQKWEVAHKSGQLEWEFKNGKPREVEFLGYPGNYGFIPQTLSGDGDALDIIVLSESVARGEVLTVKVIGMLKLLDNGEKDYKVIAVLDDGVFKKINSLKEMLQKRPNVIPIIRAWFEGYKEPGEIIFMGYEDKAKTIKYIEESHKRWTRNKF